MKDLSVWICSQFQQLLYEELWLHEKDVNFEKSINSNRNLELLLERYIWVFSSVQIFKPTML